MNKRYRSWVARYEIHPTLINIWKRNLLEGAAALFDKGHKKQKHTDAKIDELYRQIKGGTRFFVEKAQFLNPRERKAMIDSQNSEISVVQQCKLLKAGRSSVYYQPKEISPLDPERMRLIDEQYLKTPNYGSRPMRTFLQRLGYKISRK